MESFFYLSGAVSTCKPKVLDVLLLDGGGQHAIILTVTDYVIKVIVKQGEKPIYIFDNLEIYTCKYFHLLGKYCMIYRYKI